MPTDNQWRVQTQNNIYMVFSSLDGTILKWTQHLREAIEWSNKFTTVCGYKVT